MSDKDCKETKKDHLDVPVEKRTDDYIGYLNGKYGKKGDK